MLLTNNQVDELWELYKTDIRSFRDVCAEVGTSAPTAYKHFKLRGYDYKNAERTGSCKWCGKTFTRKYDNVLYCSDECRHAFENDKTKKKRKKQKTNRKSAQSIVEIARQAKKYGMTYGQYVEWRGL